jgi:hypothetical protein
MAKFILNSLPIPLTGLIGPRDSIKSDVIPCPDQSFVFHLGVVCRPSCNVIFFACGIFVCTGIHLFQVILTSLLLHIVGIINSNVPIFIVTKRFFINVDGCIVEHANVGIRLLATPQNKHTIKFIANELILSRNKQANNQTHLSGISSNTSRAWPTLATGAAAAAALIAVSEAFFAGALFTAGGFAAGFLVRCLGMGGVLATERTGGVDGAPAAGPTCPAAAGCRCPMT